MPKPRHKKSSTRNIADVTINDFANSSVCKNRPKKTAATATNLLKQVEDDDTSWDANLEDLDAEVEIQENEDGTKSVVITKAKSNGNKKTSLSKEDMSTRTGNVHPIDIWYVISEYIRPEDVGRFAGICRASCEVVRSAKFWFSLYKKHYTSVPNLPGPLQMECMYKKYGLRSSVVRALQFTYKPFASRLHMEKSEHPDVLRRYQCILMWYKSVKKQAVYYFKMRTRNSKPITHTWNKDKLPFDLLDMLDDVFANQEEDCRILQVTCKYFIPLPPVLGLTLTHATLNLSSKLRYYKLQLWFGSEYQIGNPLKTGACDNTQIVLEPVISVKVLDWWHPLYPFKHGLDFREDIQDMEAVSANEKNGILFKL